MYGGITSRTDPPGWEKSIEYASITLQDIECRASRLTTADPLGHPVTAEGKAKASALRKVADRGVVRREAECRTEKQIKQKRAGHDRPAREKHSGNNLLSHTVTCAVPSTLKA